MPALVLLRHGQSRWNLENRFTGWTDIDLSEKGIEEARTAGRLLKESGYQFDTAYTSVLKRAIRTLWIVLDEMDLMWIPVCRSWRLNERSYGALQGRNKEETVQRYGEEQVHRWRRGYRDHPPALDRDDDRYPIYDRRYDGLDESEIPRTESLEDTLKRVVTLWDGKIVPDLRAGKTVFISAHGNSLRALVKHIAGMSDEGIERFEMPTGVALVCELDDGLKSIEHYFLKD